MMRLAGLVVIFLLFLAGCSKTTRLDLYPPAELTEYKPQLQVRTRWVRQLDKGVDKHHIVLPPLIDRDRVYAANRKGRIDAYELETGNRLWSVKLETAVNSGPGDGGDVLLLGGDAEVVALNKEDGSERWRVEVGSEILAAPRRSANVIIVRSVDGGLFGLDAADGRRLWRHGQSVPLLSLHGLGEPQISGSIVVAGFDNGRIVALDLQSGDVLWETVLAVARGRTELERLVDVDAQMVVTDGVVYAAGFQGRIAALALDDGRMLWSREFSTWTGLAVTGREIYASDAESNIWALARSNGGTLWKQTALHNRVITAPAVQGGSIVVADYNGYVHWLSREEGSLLARIRVANPQENYPLPSYKPENAYREDRAILAIPQVLDDVVYVMDKRGSLNALRVMPD